MKELAAINQAIDELVVQLAALCSGYPARR